MVFNTESQVHPQAPQLLMFKLQCYVIFSVQQLVCNIENLGMGLRNEASAIYIVITATQERKQDK